MYHYIVIVGPIKYLMFLKLAWKAKHENVLLISQNLLIKLNNWLVFESNFRRLLPQKQLQVYSLLFPDSLRLVESSGKVIHIECNACRRKVVFAEK